MRGDILCCTHRTYLPRIQRGTSRPIYTVAAADLTHRKEALEICLPPDIGGETAVIVLSTESYLQRLGCKINSVLEIEINGRLIHMPQALDRRAEQCAYALKILPAALRQLVRIGNTAVRVIPEVEENAAVFQLVLDIYEYIYYG